MSADVAIEISSTMTASYDPADNKLRLRSVARLSAETYARVKAAGFAWAPRQELFVAPAWSPEREDLLLELCGEIGDEDTSLVERAEDRAERFDGYRESRTADADRAREAVASIADNIPLGQPILCGHHSEKHARKDAERIDSGMRKAIRLWDTANYWKARAAGAIRHAKYKELPAVRHRRIKGLEADVRREEKAIGQAREFSGLWSRADLTAERAKAIANYDHVMMATEEDPHGTSLWSLLEHGKIDPPAAAAHAVATHARTIEHGERWIAHLNNRLAYERAMLDESGWTPPPKPKTKADLPLLNYSGEVAYRNPWRAGEIIRAQAVGMTKSALAAIHIEYKGTRVSECGTHRVRTAMVNDGGGRALVAVFLTDSKQHPRPGADAVKAKAAEEKQAINALIADKLRAAQARAAAPKPATDPSAATFETMRETIRVGVKVVVADQLFPTPPELAARMVELADLTDAHRVLEPSAGTGALLDALVASGRRGKTVAVELNPALVDRLRRRPHGEAIREADFLACTDLGTFDRVVMNPPFERGSDIKHILHARSMLAPDGRLVAICANGPHQNEVLRPLVEACGGTWEELPAGIFAGTNVRAVLLTLVAQS